MHENSYYSNVAACKSKGCGADAGPALNSGREGDELAALDAETMAALIGLYDAAEAEDDLLSFREELEYSNALIGFDETAALGASTYEVQKGFRPANACRTRQQLWTRRDPRGNRPATGLTVAA